MLKKILPIKEKIQVGIGVNATHVSFAIVRRIRKQLEIIDFDEYQIENLVSLLSRIKQKAANFPCHLALPHHFIKLKTIFFAEPFKEKEIREMLLLNSDIYFSCKPEAVFFDFEFLNKLKKKVRIIASKKDYVNDWKTIFSQAGLTLTLASVDVLAVEKFLQYYQIIEPEKNYAVFMVNGMEFLQIVFIESFAYFVNCVKFSALNAGFLAQEMLRFLRLYESHKTFIQPISNIVLLGVKEKLVAELKNAIELPLVNGADFCTSLDQYDKYLLALGMILKC